MGSLPFALSIHHFINSVGSDAGFASIIGLAILILLYFAQARETATLRDHAREAADRIQQLEARVRQLTRTGNQQAEEEMAGQAAPGAAGQASAPGQAVGPPVAAPARVAPAAAGATASAAPTVSAAPAAPAGVAAPALSAATRLIPTPAMAVASPGEDTSVVSAPERSGGAAERPLAAREGAAIAGEGAVAAPERPVGPPPATVAGGANGASRNPAPRPVAAFTAPPRTSAREGVTSPPRRAAPSPRGLPEEDERPPSRRIVFGMLAALVVAAIVVVLIVLTSGSSGSKNAASATNASGTHRARKAAVKPGSVTVAVLNGTATPGLAHRIALQLSGQGYKEGNIATAADQTRTATVVAYLPGFRRDAMAVAGSLKLHGGSVAPVDQSTQAVACPPPTACSANVVVTVGSDLAGTQ